MIQYLNNHGEWTECTDSIVDDDSLRIYIGMYQPS